MVPELLVEHFECSRAFYVDVLWFSVRFERDDPSFAYLVLGGAQLMLEADNKTAWRTGPLHAPRGRGINLQIEVQDARTLRDAVLAAGCGLFRDLEDSRYPVDGREERHASSSGVMSPAGFGGLLVELDQVEVAAKAVAAWRTKSGRLHRALDREVRALLPGMRSSTDRRILQAGGLLPAIFLTRPARESSRLR